MELSKQEVQCYGLRIFTCEDGEHVGRLYLYILRNDLHKQPFGFIEDVYVDELHRGKGIAQELVKAAIAEAQKLGCYKIILTSRFEKEHVHRLYQKLGFRLQGYELRIDLS